MRLDGVSSCMGQLVWKRRTENRRETCLYCSCTTFTTCRTWLQFTLPTRSFRCLPFFKALTSKSMKSHFGKMQILNTLMWARAIYVVPLFLHSAIWMFVLSIYPIPAQTQTCVGTLEQRSSKPGGKPQRSEMVVQRCHHDSLGGTNFRACHVTRRRFTKFASIAYFRMPMYLFS